MSFVNDAAEPLEHFYQKECEKNEENENSAKTFRPWNDTFQNVTTNPFV